MNAKPLVVITTRLPPAICGIGTYSWRLREHWPNESRSIEFFTVDPGASPRGDRVVSFANRADDLLNELHDGFVLGLLAGAIDHQARGRL